MQDERLMFLVENYNWKTFNGFKKFIKQWSEFGMERQNEILLYMIEGHNWQKAISYTKDSNLYRILSDDKAEAAQIYLDRESDLYGENKTLGFIWNFITYETWGLIGDELLQEEVIKQKYLPGVGTVYYVE